MNQPIIVKDYSKAVKAGDLHSLYWGDVDSPFGKVRLVCTDQNTSALCGLLFVDTAQSQARTEQIMQSRWLQTQKKANQDLIEQLYQSLLSKQLVNLNLCLDGTEFQKQVWQALLTIAQGDTVSYQNIADKIGKPRAVRAVGTAIGANPISWLIPCHRVLRSDKSLGGYLWGLEKKQQLLSAEHDQKQKTKAA